LYFRK